MDLKEVVIERNLLITRSGGVGVSRIDRVTRRNKRRREQARRLNNNCYCGYSSDSVEEFNNHKHLSPQPNEVKE